MNHGKLVGLGVADSWRTGKLGLGAIKTVDHWEICGCAVLSIFDHVVLLLIPKHTPNPNPNPNPNPESPFIVNLWTSKRKPIYCGKLIRLRVGPCDTVGREYTLVPPSLLLHG